MPQYLDKAKEALLSGKYKIPSPARVVIREMPVSKAPATEQA